MGALKVERRSEKKHPGGSTNLIDFDPHIQLIIFISILLKILVGEEEGNGMAVDWGKLNDENGTGKCQSR